MVPTTVYFPPFIVCSCTHKYFKLNINWFYLCVLKFLEGVYDMYGKQERCMQGFSWETWEKEINWKA